MMLYWLIYKYQNGEEIRSEKPVTQAEADEALKRKAKDKCKNASKLIIQPVHGTEKHDTDTD
jgi:hypothetical protein